MEHASVYSLRLRCSNRSRDDTKCAGTASRLTTGFAVAKCKRGRHSCSTFVESHTATHTASLVSSQQWHLQDQPEGEPPAAICRPLLPSFLILGPFIRTGAAAAATICLDVPDWMVDWRSALFHSPVVAVGAAALALVLFPKLIRTAINYLAIPAILAMLAFAAVSFPEQSANSIYTVLEFIKEHPTASSIGIVVAAGVLLGPDLLAGTAVAGLLALLAVKLGILQMPQLPSLPKVPGQALLSRQLEKTGRALRDRLDDLDDIGDDHEDNRDQKQGGSSTNRALAGSMPTRSSNVDRAITVGAAQLRAPASEPPSLVAVPATEDDGDGEEVGQTRAQAARQLPAWSSQQPQQQADTHEAAAPGSAGLKGLAGQLGSAAKTLSSTALQQGKAAGSAVLQQGRQLQESGKLQELSAQTTEAAGKAAQGAKQAVSGLWERGKQLQGPAALQAFDQGTTAALGRLKDSVTAKGGLQGQQEPSAAGALQLQNLRQQPARGQELQGPAAADGVEEVRTEGGSSSNKAPRPAADIDSILANS